VVWAGSAVSTVSAEPAASRLTVPPALKAIPAGSAVVETTILTRMPGLDVESGVERKRRELIRVGIHGARLESLLNIERTQLLGLREGKFSQMARTHEWQPGGSHIREVARDSLGSARNEYFYANGFRTDIIVEAHAAQPAALKTAQTQLAQARGTVFGKDCSGFTGGTPLIPGNYLEGIRPEEHLDLSAAVIQRIGNREVFRAPFRQPGEGACWFFQPPYRLEADLQAGGAKATEVRIIAGDGKVMGRIELRDWKRTAGRWYPSRIRDIAYDKAGEILNQRDYLIRQLEIWSRTRTDLTPVAPIDLRVSDQRVPDGVTYFLAKGEPFPSLEDVKRLADRNNTTTRGQLGPGQQTVVRLFALIAVALGL
jgi:hypothetical protein